MGFIVSRFYPVVVENIGGVCRDWVGAGGSTQTTGDNACVGRKAVDDSCEVFGVVVDEKLERGF